MGNGSKNSGVKRVGVVGQKESDTIQNRSAAAKPSAFKLFYCHPVLVSEAREDLTRGCERDLLRLTTKPSSGDFDH